MLRFRPAGFRHTPAVASSARAVSRPGIAFALVAVTLLAAAPALAQALPPRPKIPPSGTNWSPQNLNQVAGLATVDICGVQTPQDLVNCLVKPGPNAPVISNVSFSGACHAAGTFTGGTGILGFESGIVLSSGNVASIVGPNAADGTTTINGSPGCPDLDAQIPGFTTRDCTTLEFDFECVSQQVVSFTYVFSSEEYNEFVGSPFNDVFAFFVDGVNIALIPSTATPVSINNLNCGNPYNPPVGGSNCALYINNDLTDGGGAINTEMDGLTVVLTATTTLTPGVHHLRLAIADAGDTVLDSNVFLACESFSCEPPPPEDNCPRSAGFWRQQCESRGNGSTKFSLAEVTQIAEQVDDLSSFFDWPSGTDFDRFCARIDPPKPMGAAQQALRQYAAMLANVATGILDLTASNGQKVYLRTSTPISCSGFSATTIGGLIAEIDAALLAAGATSLLEDGASEDPDGNGSDVRLIDQTTSTPNPLYANMIACLDDINNGIGIGPICTDQDVEMLAFDQAATMATLGLPAAGERGWLSSPMPNPFSGSTRLAYRVPSQGDLVRLAVYDLSGRKVRELVATFQAGGEHTVTWDSRGDDGHHVRPGVYFIRGAIGTQAVSSRVTFVE